MITHGEPPPQGKRSRLWGLSYHARHSLHFRGDCLTDTRWLVPREYFNLVGFRVLLDWGVGQAIKDAWDAISGVGDILDIIEEVRDHSGGTNRLLLIIVMNVIYVLAFLVGPSLDRVALGRRDFPPTPVAVFDTEAWWQILDAINSAIELGFIQGVVELLDIAVDTIQNVICPPDAKYTICSVADLINDAVDALLKGLSKVTTCTVSRLEGCERCFVGRYRP
jgi:hypothetical protein